MTDAQLFTRLAKLTAGAMTLEQIEEITGGYAYPSHTHHNGIEWALRVGQHHYNLKRLTPISKQFTIDDPDLAEMADYYDGRMEKDNFDHDARREAHYAAGHYPSKPLF